MIIKFIIIYILTLPLLFMLMGLISDMNKDNLLVDSVESIKNEIAREFKLWEMLDWINRKMGWDK